VVERTLYPATVAWALEELRAGRPIEPPAGLVRAGVAAHAEGSDATTEQKEQTRR
jgi:hypothetical protein